MTPVRLGVLISGSGSNLQALIDHVHTENPCGEISLVLSNRRKAYGLERARAAGIATVHESHRAYASREAYDAKIVEHLLAHRVDWVLLAGFMRIVTPTLLSAFPNRVVNIHPALLPSFKGLHAQQQALDAGVSITGATVHLVTPEMDDGPTIAQGAVPVFKEDTLESLTQRILRVEHQIYPLVARWICEHRIQTTNGHVQIQLNNGEQRSLFYRGH